MPVIRVGNESFALLVAEAQNLEISVRDLADTLILIYFGKLEAEDVDEAEEEDENEENDEEDGEGPDFLSELFESEGEEEEEE